VCVCVCVCVCDQVHQSQNKLRVMLKVTFFISQLSYNADNPSQLLY